MNAESTKRHPAVVVCGRMIRAERQRQKKTLTVLAEQSGVSFQQLSKIEKGESNTTLEVLASVADALHVPLTDLCPLGHEISPESLLPLLNKLPVEMLLAVRRLLVEHVRSDRLK
jgi:transcriptional regulator with XRE-family HTH domain